MNDDKVLRALLARSVVVMTGNDPKDGTVCPEMGELTRRDVGKQAIALYEQAVRKHYNIGYPTWESLPGKAKLALCKVYDTEK